MRKLLLLSKCLDVSQQMCTRNALERVPNARLGIRIEIESSLDVLVAPLIAHVLLLIVDLVGLLIADIRRHDGQNGR